MRPKPGWQQRRNGQCWYVSRTRRGIIKVSLLGMMQAGTVVARWMSACSGLWTSICHVGALIWAILAQSNRCNSFGGEARMSQ